MPELREILKRYWGYDAFRPLQQEIIEAVLEGRDSLAILPTGGGKSICFQVPALARTGLCLVVSPLIALMKDQVDHLKKKDIPALLIHSGMKRLDVEQTLKNATHDYFKFLYVSPERLETSLFREYLPALNVNLLAVDEAHCISQWGYDFRPSYLRIAALREELPNVPVLALTASATPLVQEDIMKKLALPSGKSTRNDWSVFRNSFERKNLSYSSYAVDAKQPRLVEIVKKVAGTAIIYCRSRRRTQEIAQLLQDHGISANSYHAGLKAEERTARQKAWIEGQVRVMVCTNAFGMGIDKPDVRLVLHADIPDCLENYYQEAGRAGRDGKKAYAVLLHQRKDLDELRAAHIVRFPTLDQVRAVYSALVNFLQVPAYAGEYKSFRFRFDDFIRNFGLQPTETLYALKALEQDGWIEYNEKNFTPSTLMFTTSKSALYEFEKGHPGHEPLLTAMLRTYGGIFDFPTFINEKMLAKLMKLDEASIIKQLQQIASFGIVSYTPRNEDPQLMFCRQRVPVQELTFKMEPYNNRKELFIQRASNMIDYAGTDRCRSQFINLYFGDEKAKPCGICDNCLKTRSGELSKEEFSRISGLVMERLSQGPLKSNDLLAGLSAYPKEKAWRVIEFLQAEHQIESDGNGCLRVP